MDSDPEDPEDPEESESPCKRRRKRRRRRDLFLCGLMFTAFVALFVEISTSPFVAALLFVARNAEPDTPVTAVEDPELCKTLDAEMVPIKAIIAVERTIVRMSVAK